MRLLLESGGMAILIAAPSSMPDARYIGDDFFSGAQGLGIEKGARKGLAVPTPVK